MKYKSLILSVLTTMLLIIGSLSTEAKPKQTKVYIFGISTSFTDSTTYITDIQTLDPAYIETATGFLYDRSIYSQQLQIWAEVVKNKPYTTCAVFFSESKSKIEKKFLQIRNKYSKDQSTKLQSLENGEFKFIPQEWTEHETL